MSDEDVKERIKPVLKTVIEPKIDEPKKWDIIMHNDPVTPMDFVVNLLVDVFQHEPVAAVDIMYNVHDHGKEVVGTYPFEIAETLLQEALGIIQSNKKSLVLTMKQCSE